MGLVLSAAGVVIGVNLLSLSDWYLRAANHMALIVLLIIGAYVCFVMAATEVRGLHRQLGGALLLGTGSLHWTITAALAGASAAARTLRVAVARCPRIGALLPAPPAAAAGGPAPPGAPADPPAVPRALAEGRRA